MIYEIPVRLESVANLREHWGKRADRARKHRMAAVIVPLCVCKLPAVVTITRIAPRKLDDDNLAAAAKAIRDGIAQRFGVPDNHPDLTWRYAQRSGKPRQYAVEIEIQGAS